ncbi:MAG: type II secretion system GspH family protein [Alphaproteobacteria bacterium]|nr:type II secretion system GspH family protein [Alphaproteobacteria bacterium]
MTLVELVITIVIVGIAVAALYSAMASISGRSADPLLRQQSLNLAEAYLEEIQLQAYSVQSEPACIPARACFNDVRDYAGLPDAPPTDARGNVLLCLDTLGNVLPCLDAYRVSVNVTGPAPLSGVPVLHITVTVTDPAGQLLSLSGYRACYGETDVNGASTCP